ncbi:hypothetical protein FSARC_7488 [Fusarium sarcochroum]|uniref:ADP-ribosylation factor n=1 Tax=Fusarium sarcochroum TaxID=1208366 RepID=A0A8H4TV51_9HYPO|nr:hypothetical protein FSARC_7488 [Fusarium sarcochroum]
MSALLAYARYLLASIGFIKPATSTPITSLFSNHPGHHRILISGLDAAGKSTLLYKYLSQREDDISCFTPTIPFNIEVYRCGQVTFQVIDLGGCRPKSFYKMERSFFKHADALIWVNDANDRDRAPETREELLRHVSYQDGLRKDVPVLILANKQDLQHALTPEQTRGYYLDDVSSSLVSRPHAVFGTNIRTGEGLTEAFEWLSKTVETRMKYDTGVVEKLSVLEVEEEVNMIIQAAFREDLKTEINEKIG